MSTAAFMSTLPSMSMSVTPDNPSAGCTAGQEVTVIVTVVEVSYVCRFTQVADMQMLIVVGSSKGRVCWNLRVVCATRVRDVSISCEKNLNTDATCQQRVWCSCKVKAHQK